MITEGTGDIFKCDAEALVNPVNCVGIMGKGLALQFKRAYPENYQKYVSSCLVGSMTPGHVLVVRENDRMIVNFPTKVHWKDQSFLSDVARGLGDLRRVLIAERVASVAVPALGCGLGGLEWTDVLPLIVKKLGDLDTTNVIVFGPQ